MFLYNSTSNIDEQGISELSLAAHLSNSIAIDSKLERFKDPNNSRDLILSELAPKFIWVLRDFSLEKVHPDTGEPISSKEYLEICLNKKISGKNSKENNIIRENIIKYFHDRDCLTLCRPVDVEEDLQNLKQIPFTSLNPEFRSDIMKLKNEIYKNSQPKKFEGKKLTGTSLSELLKVFITTINEGGIPNISNAWDNVIINDINESYSKSIKIIHDLEKELTDSFKQEEKKESLHNKISFIELIKKFTNCKKQSLLCFNQVKLINRDAFSYNKKYTDFFNEKKNELTIETTKVKKRIFFSYNTLNDKLNDLIIRNQSKNIEKAISNKIFNEKNYLDFVDMEEKFCNSCVSDLQGNNNTETFTKSLHDLIQRVFSSIESHLRYGNYSNLKFYLLFLV